MSDFMSKLLNFPVEEKKDIEPVSYICFIRML